MTAQTPPTPPATKDLRFDLAAALTSSFSSSFEGRFGFGTSEAMDVGEEGIFRSMMREKGEYRPGSLMDEHHGNFG